MLGLLSCLAGHSVRLMIAYRTEFWIELLGSGIRFGTGVLSLTVIFGNAGTINGWSEASAGKGRWSSATTVAYRPRPIDWW